MGAFYLHPHHLGIHHARQALEHFLDLDRAHQETGQTQAVALPGFVDKGAIGELARDVAGAKVTVRRHRVARGVFVVVVTDEAGGGLDLQGAALLRSEDRAGVQIADAHRVTVARDRPTRRLHHFLHRPVAAGQREHALHLAGAVRDGQQRNAPCRRRLGKRHEAGRVVERNVVQAPRRRKRIVPRYLVDDAAQHQVQAEHGCRADADQP